MITVFALAEGHTEIAFIQQVLRPHLRMRGIVLQAGRPVKSGGGVMKWLPTLRDIRGKLLDNTARYVTTRFDLYGLPSDWPGREEARRRQLKNEWAVRYVEDALMTAVKKEMDEKFDSRRLIPYIQQNEFETLLFCHPRILAETIGAPKLEGDLERIVHQCGGCEKIDDNPETAPSKRIVRLAPTYQKRTDAVIAAMKIGLAAMRERCPHFNAWVGRLENLVTAQAASPARP